MTSDELFEKLQPVRREHYECRHTADGLDVNLSDMFSTFVKEAARCNSYNSDIFYDMKEIDEAMRNFDPEEGMAPIWVGFRRCGVDGTSYVLCRASGRNIYGDLSYNYFALYGVAVEPRGGDYYDVVLSKYAM